MERRRGPLITSAARLAAMHQGVHGAELQPKKLSCAGCADPVLVRRLRHGLIVRGRKEAGLPDWFPTSSDVTTGWWTLIVLR